MDRRNFITVGGAAALEAVLTSRTRVLQALEIVTSGDGTHLVWPPIA